MKQILPLITFLFVVSCSGPDEPAETPAAPPASEEVESSSAPAPPVAPVAPVSVAKSPTFDPAVCEFLTEAQIKQILGDKITGVAIQESNFDGKSCMKPFTLTLANGNSLRLLYGILESSAESVEKSIVEYTENAETLPGLMKMEKAPDGQSYIGTHISQRRLYVFRSGQESTIMLNYDVRGAAGGKTPEEQEARRQMGLSLLAEILKE